MCVQVLAGVIANLPGLSAGLSMGFSAILIPQLQQPAAEITASLEQVILASHGICQYV